MKMDKKNLGLKLVQVVSQKSLQNKYIMQPIQVLTKEEPNEIIDELPEENNEDDNQLDHRHYHWSKLEAQKLFSLVKKYYSLLNSKGMKKRTVWEKIHQEMKLPPHVNHERVTKKWKNMYSCYRKYLVSKEDPNTRMKEPFLFEEMDSFLGESNVMSPKRAKSVGLTPQIERFIQKSNGLRTRSGTSVGLPSFHNVSFNKEGSDGESSSSSCSASLPDDSDQEQGEEENETNEFVQPSSSQVEDLSKFLTFNSSFGDAEDLPATNGSKRKLSDAEEEESSPKKIKQSRWEKWTQEKTLELLKQLRMYQPMVKENSMTKKQMWEKITLELNVGSVKSVRKKWRSMLRSYKEHVNRPKDNEEEEDEASEEPFYFQDMRSFMEESQYTLQHDSASSQDVVVGTADSLFGSDSSGEGSTDEELGQGSRPPSRASSPEANDDNAAAKNRNFWTTDLIRELLNLVKTYYPLVQDKRIRRKQVFQRILNEMENPGTLTPYNLEKKWKNMLYVYKKYLNNVTDRYAINRMREPLFFKEMSSFLGTAAGTPKDLKAKAHAIASAPPSRKSKRNLDKEGKRRAHAAAAATYCRILEAADSEAAARPKTSPWKSSSAGTPLEQSLEHLVDIERQKFEFLVLESEKKQKFRDDFLMSIKRRTELLNRLERKVDKLLNK